MISSLSSIIIVNIAISIKIRGNIVIKPPRPVPLRPVSDTLPLLALAFFERERKREGEREGGRRSKKRIAAIESKEKETGVNLSGLSADSSSILRLAL